jgi:hypothetical protein
MADEDNAQTRQQAPEPNPALKALDVMVGVWELKGREISQRVEKSAGDPPSSGWRAASYVFTT